MQVKKILKKLIENLLRNIILIIIKNDLIGQKKNSLKSLRHMKYCPIRRKKEFMIWEVKKLSIKMSSVKIKKEVNTIMVKVEPLISTWVEEVSKVLILKIYLQVHLVVEDKREEDKNNKIQVFILIWVMMKIVIIIEKNQNSVRELILQNVKILFFYQKAFFLISKNLKKTGISFFMIIILTMKINSILSNNFVRNLVRT